MPDATPVVSDTSDDVKATTVGSPQAATHQRIVLLNWLLSRSVTRAPQEYTPPTHGIDELLDFLEHRWRSGIAYEYIGALAEIEEDQENSIPDGNVIRLRQIKRSQDQFYHYATLLFEYIDDHAKSFPVVSKKTFTGREISGAVEERGAASAHLAIRWGKDRIADRGQYRCAIEAVSSITRRNIEFFLSKQLRRYAREEKFTFSVNIQKKRKSIPRAYAYRPKVDLVADVGRTLAGPEMIGRELSQIVFLKRYSKESVAVAADVRHKEFIADLEVKVSGKQAPKDPAEQKTWLSSLKDHYNNLGYEAKIYYRHHRGALLSGAIHEAVDGAADLLFCPREHISLPTPPRRWEDAINDTVATALIAVLNSDGLWVRTSR